MIILQQIKGKGKESGKDFTAYQFQLGKWKSPYMFIRSDFELDYIKEQCEEEGIEYREA